MSVIFGTTGHSRPIPVHSRGQPLAPSSGIEYDLVILVSHNTQPPLRLCHVVGRSFEPFQILFPSP